MFFYPGTLISDTTDIVLCRIARHSECSDCDCPGLHPSPDNEVVIVELDGQAEITEDKASCECGHPWRSHGNINEMDEGEMMRLAKVALRIDELIDVRHCHCICCLLRMFPSVGCSGTGEF